MMLARLFDYSKETENKYRHVLGYAVDKGNPIGVFSTPTHGMLIDGTPDYIVVKPEQDYVDDLVDDYLNGLGMVAISRTNCPICGEDYFNGWRCNCLSPDAQTKFQWRYK